MLAYVARRLAMAVGTVFAAVVISFLLVHASDGSPGAIRLGVARHRRPRSPRRTTRWAGTARWSSSSSTTSATWSPVDLGHVADRRPVHRRRPARPAAGHRLDRPVRDPPVRRRRRRPRRHRRGPRRAVRPVHHLQQRRRALPAGVLGRHPARLRAVPPAGLAPRHRVRAVHRRPGRLVHQPDDPGPHADRRRRGDHRPHRQRGHARGARARSTSAPCGRWARPSGGSATCTRCGSPACRSCRCSASSSSRCSAAR